jgi:hypothetical protein
MSSLQSIGPVATIITGVTLVTMYFSLALRIYTRIWVTYSFDADNCKFILWSLGEEANLTLETFVYSGRSVWQLTRKRQATVTAYCGFVLSGLL